MSNTGTSSGEARRLRDRARSHPPPTSQSPSPLAFFTVSAILEVQIFKIMHEQRESLRLFVFAEFAELFGWFKAHKGCDSWFVMQFLGL